jgi:hypothetical protein
MPSHSPHESDKLYYVNYEMGRSRLSPPAPIPGVLRDSLPSVFLARPPEGTRAGYGLEVAGCFLPSQVPLSVSLVQVPVNWPFLYLPIMM